MNGAAQSDNYVVHPREAAYLFGPLAGDTASQIEAHEARDAAFVSIVTALVLWVLCSYGTNIQAM